MPFPIELRGKGVSISVAESAERTCVVCLYGLPRGCTAAPCGPFYTYTPHKNCPCIRAQAGCYGVALGQRASMPEPRALCDSQEENPRVTCRMRAGKPPQLETASPSMLVVDLP